MKCVHVGLTGESLERIKGIRIPGPQLTGLQVPELEEALCIVQIAFKPAKNRP